jgi:hypothetical protein
LRAAFDRRRGRDRERHKLLNKARYHARRLLGPGGDVSDYDLATLSTAVDALVEAGVAPSSPELRDLLRPVWEDLSDRELTPGVRAVVEVVATRQQQQDAPVDGNSAEGDAPARKRSQEVERVAAMLGGRAMVLIGGECRDYSRRAIEQSLGLAQLLWLDAPEHESIYRFEPAVARPEVALVAVIIKLSSHSFGDVKDLCRRYGKSFVFLTHGYNARQIARAVLEQCSRQLEPLPPAAATAAAD